MSKTTPASTGMARLNVTTGALVHGLHRFQDYPHSSGFLETSSACSGNKSAPWMFKALLLPLLFLTINEVNEHDSFNNPITV